MRRIVITGLVAAAAVVGSVLPAVTAGAGTAATAAPAVTASPAALARLAGVARPSTVISADLGAMGDKISCASPTACLAVGGNGGETGRRR